jgi:putative nucleotidyltransferase with HDIG domain
MRKSLKFFTSRLARRFFLMFIASALIPIIVLAVVAYNRVTRQVTDQTFDRLRQSVKAHALDVYERLVVTDYRLQTMETILSHAGSKVSSLYSPAIAERNRELFTGLVLLRNNKIAFSWGEGVSNACHEMVRTMNIAKDTSTLISLDEGKEWPTIAIVHGIESNGDSRSYIIGTVNPSFLWGLQGGTGLAPASEFSVWDDQERNLFCSLGYPLKLKKNLLQDLGEKNSGQTTLTIQNESYHAFFWLPFMKPRFHIPHWTVMVMEPRGHMLQPINSFRTVFLSIIVLSFLIVVFLTNRAIRSSLIPIDALMDGARRVADGFFSHQVIVESKDEFHDVAIAFNHMSNELDAQFKALSARSNLDSAVLSVLDIDQIITTSLDHAGSFISHSLAAISVVEEVSFHGRSYIRENNDKAIPLRIKPFQLSPEEHALFLKNRNWIRVDIEKITLSYLEALCGPDVQHFIVFPVWVQNRLFALVSLGVHGNANYGQRDLENMRGFVDHLSIAFDNSNLLKQLKDLNMGTLYALARTVDAKSPWTAGHSVRVTQLTMDIGKVLGLPQEVLEDLQSAALLHDIGKIGIPQTILDKPGKLTSEEYDVIKTHPSIGARILGPINAYKRIIPIVEEHHERYDGKGYPFGKSGEEIHLSARIMALADAYDAMVSDRPYRAGLSNEKAIRIIQEEAGRQFDPHVVEAFNKVVDSPRGVFHFEPLSQSITSPATIFNASVAEETEDISYRRREGKLS